MLRRDPFALLTEDTNIEVQGNAQLRKPPENIGRELWPAITAPPGPQAMDLHLVPLLPKGSQLSASRPDGRKQPSEMGADVLRLHRPHRGQHPNVRRTRFTPSTSGELAGSGGGARSYSEHIADRLRLDRGMLYTQKHVRHCGELAVVGHDGSPGRWFPRLPARLSHPRRSGGATGRGPPCRLPSSGTGFSRAHRNPGGPARLGGLGLVI
jgi:hypothetical protein